MTEDKDTPLADLLDESMDTALSEDLFAADEPTHIGFCVLCKRDNISVKYTAIGEMCVDCIQQKFKTNQ